MTSKHKLIHFLSLVAILVNLLMPLGAPLVTAQDIASPEAETSVIIDADGDGVADDADNCPDVGNAGQEDIDGDGIGDACDAVNDLDLDGDGVNNDVDNCPDIANADQADLDGDGIGDACDLVNDLDLDGDGISNDVDNCPNVANADQIDLDGDGIGDACDSVNDLDLDSDGISNDVDNCPNVANADQTDLDGDGIGDACDDFVVLDKDADGVNDAVDACPDVAAVSDANGDGCEDVISPVDTDGDGVTDEKDTCPEAAAAVDANGDGCEDEAPGTDPEPIKVSLPLNLFLDGVCVDPALLAVDVESRWAPGMPDDTDFINYRLIGPTANNTFVLTAELKNDAKWSDNAAAGQWVSTNNVSLDPMVQTQNPDVLMYSLALLEPCVVEPEAPVTPEPVAVAPDAPMLEAAACFDPAKMVPTTVGVKYTLTGPDEANAYTLIATLADETFVWSEILGDGWTVDSQGVATFDMTTLTPCDSDGDGILNDVDNCSDMANEDQKDVDEDGIGDLCDDEDNREKSLETKIRALDEDGVAVTEIAWGDPLIFEITITNTGERDVQNIVVAIQLENLSTPECKTPLDSTLAAGQSITCTADYTFPEDGDFTELILKVDAKGTVVPEVDPSQPQARMTVANVETGEEVIAPQAEIVIMAITGNYTIFSVESGGAEVGPGNGPYADKVYVTVSSSNPGNGFDHTNSSYRHARTGQNSRYLNATCKINSTDGEWVEEGGKLVWRGGTWSGALGAPRSSGISIPDGTTPSIGWGGTMELWFIDNKLVASGNGDADLWIQERGSEAEPAYVYIMAVDGGPWIPVGQLSSGNNSIARAIDIDAFPGVSAGKIYDRVKIVDSGVNYGLCSESRNYAGADIDAVWALSSTIKPTNPTWTNRECKDGSQVNFTLLSPTSTDDITYSWSPTPAPGGTSTLTATLKSGSGTNYIWDLSAAPGWRTTSDARKITFEQTFPAGTSCSPTTVPAITTDAWVCTDGATSGVNEFTVSAPNGFTITSIQVGGVSYPAAAGTYDLPSANGQYTITVKATLQDGFAPPAEPTPVNKVYTFTKQMKVAKCKVTVPPTVTADPYVCIDGVSSGTNKFIVTSIGEGLIYDHHHMSTVANYHVDGAPMEFPMAPSGETRMNLMMLVKDGYATPSFGGTDPNISSWTEDGVTYLVYEWRVTSTPCQPIVPTISTDAWVCTAGATSGVNEFTVSAPNGFTITSIQVGGVSYPAAAGTYDLPTANGEHTITVKATLNPGYSVPPRPDPVGDVYTWTQQVTVAKCLQTTPPSFTSIAAICTAGVDVDGSIAVTPSTAGGFKFWLNTDSTTRDAAFTYTDLAADDYTLTAQLKAGFAVPDMTGWTPVDGKTNTWSRTVPVADDGCDPTQWPGLSTTVSTCVVGSATDPLFSLGVVEGLTSVVTVNGHDVNGTDKLTATTPFALYTLTGASPYSIQVTLTLLEGYSWPPASDPFHGRWEIDGTSATLKTPVTIAQVECDPEVSILKTVNDGSAIDGYFTAGDSIEFTIEVTNSGQGKALDVGLSDSIPAGLLGLTWTPGGDYTDELCDFTGGVLTCSDITLDEAGGANDTFTVTLTSSAITAAGPVCNEYTNTAALTGDYQGQSSARVNILCDWDFSVLKKSAHTTDADQNGEISLGDTITYTITVANTGNMDLFGLTLDDVFSGDATGLKWVAPFDGKNIPTLAVNGSINLVATYVVTQADVDAGEIENCANVYFMKGLSLELLRDACFTDLVPQHPSVTLVKTGPDAPVLPGEAIEFTITFTNTGNVTVANATIDDDLDGLMPLPTGEWTITKDGSPVTLPYTENDLAPGGSVTILVSAAVPSQIEMPNTTWCKQWDNTATVLGAFANGDAISDSYDATAQVNCTSLQITKTGSATVAPGGNVNYTITVENLGNTNVYGVVVADTLDSRLTPVSASIGAGTCDISDQLISCNIASLAPGATVTVSVNSTLVLRPTAQQCDTDIVNSATISQFNLGGTALRSLGRITLPGTLITSNQVVTDILCSPNVTYHKAGPNAAVQPGENIVFTVTVSNDGSYPAADVMLTDNIPAALAGLTWNISTNDAAASCERIGDSISCTNIDLAAYDGEFILTLTAATTAEEPVCGTYTNYAGPTNGSRAQQVSDTVTIACVPDYEMGKDSELTNDVDEDGVVSLGDTITYTIHIENNGNVELSGLTLDDDFTGSDTLVWTAPVGFDGIAIPDIAVGGELDLVATYVVTQIDVDAGTIENCATISLPGTQLAPNSCADDDIPQTPGIDVEKESTVDMTVVAPTDRVDAGDRINFTFTVENTGNVTLTNVVLEDPFPGLTWIDEPNIGTMAPGDIVELEAWAPVTQVQLDYGQVTNCADVVGDPPLYVSGEPGVATFMAAQVDPTEQVSDDDCATSELPPMPGIDIEKEASIDMTVVDPADRVDAGDVITYTITVVNTGNTTLTNVHVLDPLAGLDETLSSLAPGEDAVFTVDYTILLSDLDAGEVYNCADATADGPIVEVLAFAGMKIENEAYAYDEDCITTELENEPGIDVEKTDTLLKNVVGVEDRVDAGDTIEYTITVTNTGNVTLVNVVVNDPLVGFTETLASLAPGVTETFTATYEVTQADLDAATVQNCADATGQPPMLDIAADRVSVLITGDSAMPTNVFDEDCIDTPLVGEPGIDIRKSAELLPGEDGRMDAGDLIEYTIIVTNTGNTTLTNIVVSDDLIGLNETIEILAPEGSQEFTKTYAVPQGVIDAGLVENCADATADGPRVEVLTQELMADNADNGDEKPYAFDEDCIETEIAGEPAVDLEKVGALNTGDDDVLNAGDIITYEFKVTNTGNITLIDLVVEDPIPGISWTGENTIASLDPGASVTLSATYAVTQANIDAGEVENCATAMNDLASDEDCYTTPLTPGPAVDLLKTASAATGDDDLLNVDEVITYTFEVTNTGNTTITNLTIADPMEGLTWTSGNTIATLAPGASVELTATYSVTLVDVAMGTIVNCADVTGNAGETMVMDEDCATTSVDQNPSVLVVQECPGPVANFLPGVGEDVTWEITITNDGDVPLRRVALTSSREAVFTNPGTTDPADFDHALAPGESYKLWVTFRVTQEDIDRNEVQIEVTAVGTYGDGSQAKLASMAFMQVVDDEVTETIALTCPRGQDPTPVKTPVKTPASVAGLPSTGSGTGIVAGSSIIWAATIATVALGLGGIGTRRMRN